MGKQGIFLEYSIQISLVGRQIGDVCSIKDHLPGIGIFKSSQDAQGSGLTAAAWSQKGEKFVFPDRKIQLIQDDLIPKTFGYINQIY